MVSVNKEKIQIRIDSNTKNRSKNILDSLGVNMSSVRNAKLLRESIASVKNSDKYFNNGRDLINDAINS